MSGVRVGVATPGRRRSTLERVGRALAAPLGGSLRSAGARVLEQLLNAGTAGRGLKCRLPEGEVVRVLPRYRDATWNLEEYRAFRRVLAPGAIALDIGASIGSYALLFGQWVRPGGRVYAFEPAPAVHAALERHIALNHLDGIVVPVAAAASESSGRASFVIAGSHGLNRFAGRLEEAAVVVDTITIDDFCAREGIAPTLIKIDVEGAELGVLRGARRTLRARAKEMALFVELHPSLWPGIGVSREMIETELASMGLRVEPPAGGGDPWSLEGVALRVRPA